jgi:four helix bundle protein
LNLTPENATDAPDTSVAPDAPPFRDPSTPADYSREESLRSPFDHERLHCYAVALEFAAMVPSLTQAARPSLRDQLERAAASIVLNLAEGCGRRTRRDRNHFFSMAQGSAMECAAAIDLLRVNAQIQVADATRAKHKLTRVVQMLVGLRR